jgi:hypothetical protein
MSKAFQCDRCKHFYSGEPRVLKTNFWDSSQKTGYVKLDHELCKKCSDELHRLLNGWWIWENDNAKVS